MPAVIQAFPNSTPHYFSIFKHSTFPVWPVNLPFWTHIFLSILWTSSWTAICKVEEEEKCFLFTPDVFFHVKFPWFNTPGLSLPSHLFLPVELQRLSWLGSWELGLGLHSLLLSSWWCALPTGSTCPRADSALWHQQSRSGARGGGEACPVQHCL